MTNIITLHLGNGCSAAAIRGGHPVDTSMGMTPLEGLVMGARSGDLDPSICNLIAGKEGLSLHEVETLLNTQSGLLGISGLTNDMKVLQEELKDHDDRRVRLAIEVFCYRVRKYIGAFLVHPDDRQPYAEKWRACVATGEPLETEGRFRCSATGEYRWFHARGVPLRDKHGRIRRWYGILTDIEDRKRAEEEREKLHQLEADLAHINRVSMMGELAASIAHEVNQPLTGIVSNGSACGLRRQVVWCWTCNCPV